MNRRRSTSDTSPSVPGVAHVAPPQGRDLGTHVARHHPASPRSEIRLAGYGELEPCVTTPGSSRQVRYAHSPDFPACLAEAGISILISTYQAGKLVVLSTSGERLELSFHNYDRPMGIAVDEQLDCLAVATKSTIWIAKNDTCVASQLASPGPTGACFLTRIAHHSGNIEAHQIAWCKRELWIVNTRFSCLCTFDDKHSFAPRWQPPFIDTLAAEDRCHLNGMAIENHRPKYVTTLAETNVADGWRPVKNRAGCLIDVDSHEVVARGFAMPHSPVVHDGHAYLLNSGFGSLVHVDSTGRVDEVGRFPGFTRGLAVHGNLAVVGLSKIRDHSTFGDLPIAERANDLKCGIAIVNLSNGTLHSQFEFQSGVEEIFDVNVVPCPGRFTLRGPHETEDGHEPIWVLPSPRSLR